MNAPQDVVAGMWVQDGKVLLCQRHPSDIAEWCEAWALPGGKVEPGETPEQALKREWREELTGEISVGQLLHTAIYRTQGYPRPYRVHVFLVTPTSLPELTHAGGQAISMTSIGIITGGTLKQLPSTRTAMASYLNLVGA